MMPEPTKTKTRSLSAAAVGARRKTVRRVAPGQEDLGPREAVRTLAAVADVDALAALRRLAGSACTGPALEELAGARAVARLVEAGLVHGDRYGVLALSPRGRDAWMAVRGLC